MKEQVVLVDKAGNEIGCADKISVHVNGTMHRAFSIFVFSSQGKLLIQQRNRSKYHTPGLWSNTCCSHPRPGEALAQAVQRRLAEEMGFVCDLAEIFSCSYELQLDNKMIEHELNHVFIGYYDGDPVPDPAEVEDWRWQTLQNLGGEVSRSPGSFTPWFKLIMQDYDSFLCKALRRGGLGNR
jgi:isopentenyl-diphosphate delta-isomerase